MKYNKQKGAALLITILVMAALLSIALGIARLSIGEIKLVRDIPNSMIAYYAAEAGVERALFEEWQGSGAEDRPICSVILNNNSCYGITVDDTGGTLKIKSTGSYLTTNRSIEVSFSD